MQTMAAGTTIILFLILQFRKGVMMLSDCFGYELLRLSLFHTADVENLYQAKLLKKLIQARRPHERLD